MNENYVEGVVTELGELVPQIRNVEGSHALWAYKRGERTLAYLYRVSAVRWRVLMPNYGNSLFENVQEAIKAIEVRERRRSVPLSKAGRLMVRMGILPKAVSLRTLTRWAEQGKLHAYKMRSKGRGGSWRVKLGDLHGFVPPKRGRI